MQRKDSFRVGCTPGLESHPRESGATSIDGSDPEGAQMPSPAQVLASWSSVPPVAERVNSIIPLSRELGRRDRLCYFKRCAQILAGLLSARTEQSWTLLYTRVAQLPTRLNCETRDPPDAQVDHRLKRRIGLIWGFSGRIWSLTGQTPSLRCLQH